MTSRQNVVRSINRKSKTKQAQLCCSVSRVDKLIRQRRIAKQVSSGAAVVAAGMLEYIQGELIELAIQQAAIAKRKRILPAHVRKAIGSDDEFVQFFQDAIGPRFQPTTDRSNKKTTASKKKSTKSEAAQAPANLPVQAN